jgi:hypothetical protein
MLEDLALAIERQMVGVFIDRDMGRQARAGPRSMGRDGSGACVKFSQPEQVKRGRTMRGAENRPGRYSNSSVTSSPKRRSAPPHWAQSASPVVSSTSIRGM